MSEFFQVPVRREDGSEGTHFINIDAISYVDLEIEGGKVVSEGVRIHLNDGYWFTLSGPKAEEILGLIKNRECMHFGEKRVSGGPDGP